MKFRILYFFIAILSFSNLHAQKKTIQNLENFEKTKIRYGYYLGLHYKGYQLKANNNVNVTGGAGFHLGVLADLNFNKYISLITEPGVISTSNKLTIDDTEFQIPTTHFYLPFALKFRTKRINNVRAYVQAGVGYSYNFISEKNKGDNGNSPNDFLLSQNNFMGEAKIGANFYFEYFKFSPSLNAIYGFNNEFKGLGTNAKQSLQSLKTRGVFLTLTFQ